MRIPVTASMGKLADELVLTVEVPGRILPTAVEIGLSGSGEVARTILYSMEKA